MPKSVMASSISSMVPSPSMRASTASFMYGMSIRFTANPGPFFTLMGSFPMIWENSIMTPTVSREVFSS